MKIELVKQTGVPRRCEILGCGKRAEWMFVTNSKQFAVCCDCVKNIKIALKSFKDKNEEGVENAKK